MVIHWESVTGESRREWLIADESEAEDIAAAADRLAKWPSLVVEVITEDHLATLWKLLAERGDGAKGSVIGDCLIDFSDEFPGPNVCRVLPEFIDALASLQKSEWAEY